MSGERERLARQIHDTTAQSLTGLVLQLGVSDRTRAVTLAMELGLL